MPAFRCVHDGVWSVDPERFRRLVGLYHPVARALDLRVRSKNSGRELKEKILHQCYVLTTGVEF